MKISKKWGHKISKIVGGQNGSRVHGKIGGGGGYLGGHWKIEPSKFGLYIARTTWEFDSGKDSLQKHLDKKTWMLVEVSFR